MEQHITSENWKEKLEEIGIVVDSYIVALKHIHQKELEAQQQKFRETLESIVIKTHDKGNALLYVYEALKQFDQSQ